MSDHTYTCKRCGSWWSCACDDGSPDDLCTDCLLQQQKDDELKGGDFNLTLAIIKERDDEIARLKADYAICREEYATIQHHKEVLLERYECNR